MNSEDRPLGGTKRCNFEEYPPDASSLPRNERPLGGSRRTNFDEFPPDPVPRNERPLGGKGSYLPENLSSENPEDPPDDSAEDSGPIDKRLDSKAWKTRDKAVDELMSLLKTDASASRGFLEFVPKLVGDAHPVVQEKGLEVFKYYLEKSPALLVSQTEVYVKVLVEKGVSNTKQGIRQSSSDLLLDLFEHQPADVDSFIQGIVACLDNKAPKVQTAGVTFTISLISVFGVRVVPFKVFLPYAEKFAAGSNAGLRTESLNLFKELYKWVKELVMPSLQGLKKPQQQELQKAFEEIKENPTPSRHLKCKGPDKGGSLEIFDLAEPRDIFSKYNQDWVDKVMEMEKWADKKTALEAVCLEANYPKLANKNPEALVELCKKMINDNNVNVMVQALKLVGLLSKGLRKSFEIYSRQFFSIFLAKLKEKKTLVVQEIYVGLDNLLFSLALDSVLIELEEALDDKATAQKTNLLIWLQKIAESLPNDQLQKSAKEIALMVKKITDDNTASIRTESFKLLFLLLKRFPDQINSALKDFPPAKMKKIHEFSGGEVIEEAKPEKIEEKKPEKVEKKAEKIEEKAKPDNKKPQKKKKNPEDEDPTALISAEEAESVMSEFLPGGVIEKLKENGWKEKTAALSNLSDWVRSSKSAISSHHESVFRLIKTCLKDWKENNMAVNKSALDLMNMIGEMTEINRKAAYVVLCPTALDKLADGKITESFTVCILTVCENVSPKFVAGYLLKAASDCSKPKLFSESCAVLSRIIAEFGLHRLVLKDFVDLCKTGLGQANPVIKKGSTALLCVIYGFIGEALLPLLKDVKDATMKSVMEDLSKVEKNTKSQFRSVKCEEEEVKFDPKKLLDNAIPRVNISAAITDKIIAKLTDGNWKVRKEGLDDIEAVLESNGKRVLPAGLDEMFKTLKAKLEDSNKSIARSTLGLVCKLVESIGSEIKMYNMYIVPGLLSCLGDKQSLLRQEAIAAIDKWALETGPESIVNFAGPPLVHENPELRTELLAWLIGHKEAFPKSDLKQLAGGILQSLQDKTAAIRNSAELLFSETINLVGFEVFSALLQDVKPAVVNTLKPIFEKYKTEEPAEKPKQAEAPVSKQKPIKRQPTGKIVADHEVKPSTRNKKEALDIRIASIGEKEKRLDFDSKYKWSVEEIRPDYLDKLKEQIRAAFSVDLGNLLFHEDFKKQAEAAGHLNSIIESEEHSLVDYFDLVFKWSWIELIISSNTQIYKAVLELDLMIVSKLDQLGYTCTETEASLILPVLCDKSGQNNVAFRVLIRNIIHSFCKIHPPDKVFAVVMTGINSKNARSKVECIEEVGSLIKDFGEAVFQAKDVKVLSKQVNSADNNVRAAAVNTIAEIFKVYGDKTWGLIGDLPEKAKGILEQRFKVKLNEKNDKTEETKKPVKKNLDKRADVRKSIDPPNKLKDMASPKFAEDGPQLSNTLKLTEGKKFHAKNQFSEGKASDKSIKSQGKKIDMGKVAEKIFNIEKDLGKVTEPTIEEPRPGDRRTPREGRIGSGERVRPLSRDPSSDRPPRSARVQSPRLTGEEKVSSSKEILIDELEIQESREKRSELSSMMLSLMTLDPDLQIAGLETLDSLIENHLSLRSDFKLHASQIIFTIVCTFSRVSIVASPSFFSTFFRVVNKVCTCESIIRYLNEKELYFLVEELLKVLSNESFGPTPDPAENELIVKTVNSSIVKLLEIPETSVMLSTILKLLHDYKQSNLAKMNAVLIKCVLKVTKNISANKSSLDITSLLSHILRYLMLEPNEETGTKAMRTIVNELVKVVGEEILQVYQNFLSTVSEDPYIGEWIDICIRANAPPPPVACGVESTKDLLNLLASSESYNLGVQELSNYLETRAEVDPYEVLSVYPDAFKEKILADVRDFRSKRTPNSSSAFNSSEMKNRIAMMKQRLGLGAGDLK